MAERNRAVIIAEYIEVETGKSATRPKLLEAIHHAGLTNSTLVVAKLDRLARNAYFTRTLKESEQKFTCCDNEHANDLTIDLLAVIAEHEARAIAARTREALAVTKERGKLLGSARPGHWDGREDRRALGYKKSQPLAAASNSQKAQARYQTVLVPEIKRRREAGESLVMITAWLNEQGFRTRPTNRCPEGSTFTPKMVWRLIDRYLGKELLGNITLHGGLRRLQLGDNYEPGTVALRVHPATSPGLRASLRNALPREDSRLMFVAEQERPGQ